MQQRRVVAGRRRLSSVSREPAKARKPKVVSKGVVLTGIVIPIVGIITAFFTEPVNEARKGFELSFEPPITATVKWMRPYAAGGVMFPNGLLHRDGKPVLDGGVQNFPEMGGVVVRQTGNWGASRYQVELVGNRQENVRIQGIRARVVERRPIPATADFISWVYEGGGSIDALTVNLDDDNRVLKSRSSGRPFLDEEFRYVEKGEPFVFNVQARTQQCWCQWELVVDVAYSDEETTVVIRSDGTNSGSPFQTLFWPDQPDTRFANEYAFALSGGDLVDCRAERPRVPGACNF